MLVLLQVIPEDAQGLPDCSALEARLLENAGAPLQLGCFSAGSNVTGILADVQTLAGLLHRHGALAAFDYAAAGGCTHIQCTGAMHLGRQDCDLDVVMLSPHKLPGGPGSSGVLVVRRSIVRTAKPQIAGTV